MRAIMLVCLVVCALVIGVSVGSSGAQTGKPVVIGWLVPIGGALAEHGAVNIRGIEMAVEEINAAGGMLGRPVATKILDTKYKPDTAVRAAESLVYDFEAAFLMGCLITSETKAVSEWAKNKKMLYVGFGVSDFLTSEEGHRYFFRGSAPGSVQQLGNVLNMKGKNLKKLWTIAPDYAFGHATQKQGIDNLKKMIPEIEVIGESWPPLDEKDFSPYITKIMSSGADAIYSFLFGGTQIGFIKQATQFGLLKKMRYAGGDFTPVNVRPLGKDGAEGMLGFSQYEWTIPDIEENRAFNAKYEKRYGTKAHAYAAMPYCNMLMLAAAVKKAGTLETEAVIDAMEKVKVPTPYSKETYYRACDHNLSIGLVVGETVYQPGLDFLAVQKNAWYLEPEKAWPTCEEVEKARAAKK
jgi:branched-chain amino acid transport system substrate-binding protein